MGSRLVLRQLLQNDYSRKNTAKRSVSYLNLSEGNAANSVKLSCLHFERSLMTVIYPVSQAVQWTVFQMVWNGAIVPVCLIMSFLFCFCYLLPQMSAVYPLYHLIELPFVSELHWWCDCSMNLCLIYKFTTELWAKFWSFNQQLCPLRRHPILFMASVTFSGP